MASTADPVRGRVRGGADAGIPTPASSGHRPIYGSLSSSRSPRGIYDDPMRSASQRSPAPFGPRGPANIKRATERTGLGPCLGVKCVALRVASPSPHGPGGPPFSGPGIIPLRSSSPSCCLAYLSRLSLSGTGPRPARAQAPVGRLCARGLPGGRGLARSTPRGGSLVVVVLVVVSFDSSSPAACIGHPGVRSRAPRAGRGTQRRGLGLGRGRGGGGGGGGVGGRVRR